MHIMMTQRSLKAAVEPFAGVCAGYDRLSMYSHLHLRADGEKLTIRGARESLRLELECDCETKEPGALWVLGESFVKAALAMDEGIVELETAGKGFLSVKGGSAVRYDIAMRDSSAYPEWPEVAVAGETWLCYRPIMEEMLRKTVYAMSSGRDGDTYLKVVHGIVRGGRVTLEATDGRRLARVEQDLDMVDEVEADFTIPGEAARLLYALLVKDGKPADVRIATLAGETEFASHAGGWKLVAKQQAAKKPFPGLGRIIDAFKRDMLITVDRVLLLNALKKMLLTCDGENRIVKVSVAKGRMKLAGKIDGIMSGEAEFACACESPKTYRASFNAKLLLDAIGAIDDDEVQLDVGEDGVLAIRSSVPALAMVMPLREG